MGVSSRRSPRVPRANAACVFAKTLCALLVPLATLAQTVDKHELNLCGAGACPLRRPFFSATMSPTVPTTIPKILPKIAFSRADFFVPFIFSPLGADCDAAAANGFIHRAELDCPMTRPFVGELMSDPVRLPSGNVCDRLSIERVLMNDDRDPFSRQTLRIEDVVPDEELRGRIEAWKREQGL